MLGLNLEINEWERKVRIFKKNPNSIGAVDELFSVEDVAMLPDGADRDEVIGAKLFKAIVRDDAHTVEELLHRYGDRHVLAQVFKPSKSHSPRRHYSIDSTYSRCWRDIGWTAEGLMTV